MNETMNTSRAASLGLVTLAVGRPSADSDRGVHIEDYGVRRILVDVIVSVGAIGVGERCGDWKTALVIDCGDMVVLWAKEDETTVLDSMESVHRSRKYR